MGRRPGRVYDGGGVVGEVTVVTGLDPAMVVVQRYVINNVLCYSSIQLLCLFIWAFG